MLQVNWCNHDIREKQKNTMTIGVMTDLGTSGVNRSEAPPLLDLSTLIMSLF